MEKDMALKWKKVKAKGQARVVSNFKKKWIPFVLEFAQANLRKVNEAKLSSYRKGMKFLSSGFAERFDEDGFENYWRSGGYEKENMEMDNTLMKILLERFQSRFKWISKYMGRKEKTDARQYPLHHVITTSILYINRHWEKNNFVIEHSLYGAEPEDLEIVLQFREKIEKFEEIKSFLEGYNIPISEVVLMKPWNESLRLMNKAVFFFIRLLDGLPVSSIRKCIGYHPRPHYFLHLTKREKEYCTPSCAGRSIQQKKREDLKKDPKDYERFKREQRFRMGELRLGPGKYSAHLKKHDKNAWKSYEQWRKLREKIVSHRSKKREKKVSVKVF